ncbi:hypothetical protein F5B22DRAFT_607287 [Xylaria bambusicola]|uniref:uncharacterized protein n=1 Tax=Xylaria bambusicola TaxID=326684 RepID=UPI00200727F9|nr:uncharacterized protein F5B22DRAFT_607287 [Xylaria bambusicola]KAI0515415.1 hypothetical protein F5B22DRAFT_607287 [Xylaria bambusicola]
MLSDVLVPTSCLQETWLSPLDATPRALLGNPKDPKCWAGAPGEPIATISPAICPSGYTSVLNQVQRKDASETVWECCPSGYFHDTGYYSCRSLFDSRSLFDDGQTALPTVFVTMANDDGSTTVTPIPVGGVNAHSIRVAFHSSDLLTGQSDASTEPPPSTTTASTSSPLRSPTSGTTQAPNPQSVSPGGLAGIGVGSALGAVFILLGVFWLMRRRRQKKLRQQNSPPPPPQVIPTTSDTMVLPSDPVGKYPEPLSTSRVPELSATPPIHELHIE